MAKPDGRHQSLEILAFYRSAGVATGGRSRVIFSSPLYDSGFGGNGIFCGIFSHRRRLNGISSHRRRLPTTCESGVLRHELRHRRRVSGRDVHGLVGMRASASAGLTT